MIDLLKLNQYKKVYIQPHNFPDADAVASAFGLYELLTNLNIDSEIICYTTRTASTKPNLDKMLREIENDITYNIRTVPEDVEDYALFLIDVQQDNSNITPLNAKYIYCIDHHEACSSEIYVDSDVRPSIGSSSTIITKYFQKYQMTPSSLTATLLSFGIYQDTGSLSEKTTNLDTDCKMWLNDKCDADLYNDLIHSSFTYADLSIIASALKSAEQYRNVVFCKVSTWDDNMLGNISDTLSEVSDIDISIAYADKKDGWKLSIRSYNKLLSAVDVVQHLTGQFSSLGGGHLNKSGGFISKEDFIKIYNNITFDIWLKSEVIMLVNKWMDAIILYSDKKISEDMLDHTKSIQKLQNPVRYIKLTTLDTDIVHVKTLTGNVSVNPKTHYIIIGIFGDIYPISIDSFSNLYTSTSSNDIYCIGDTIIAKSYAKEGYGIKIGTQKFTLEDIFKLPTALPSPSIRRSYKLKTPCLLYRNDGVLKGVEGDYVIISSNGYPTHISRQDVYVQTFNEI